MAKFIFLEPYTIRIGDDISYSQDGATGGTIVKSFNTGDVIEGIKKSQPAGVPGGSPYVYIETIVDGQTFAIADSFLKEYTEVEKAKLTNTQKWAIIIGGSALIYYILYKTGALK